MKKFVAVMLAVIMVFSLAAITPFAEEAEPLVNLDRLTEQDSLLSVVKNYAGDSTVTILQGSKLNILGWAWKDGTNVDKVFWRYIPGESGKFGEDSTDDIHVMECSDTYRVRDDLVTYFGQADNTYFKRSGLGKDEDLMELLGVDALEVGTYQVRIDVAFQDGTTKVLKKKFTLVVKERTEITSIIDFDEADAYGMSFDAFYWNGGSLGGGRNMVDYFGNPDAMPVHRYGGVCTGFAGWVAFRGKKIAEFGYLVNGELITSLSYVYPNEDTLGPTVDSWEGWSGAGETVQRFNLSVPFAGLSGVADVMVVAVLEDGTAVRLNSQAIHDRNTEVFFTFLDGLTLFDDNTALSTGWWTNPFNSSSTAEISFTAPGWFNGFELFVFAAEAAQPVHATLKDSEGNTVYEKDFSMAGNFYYSFYEPDAAFAPGDYTLVFDGSKMAEGASTWFVIGSGVLVEGRVISATGGTDQSTLTGPVFRLIATEEPAPVIDPGLRDFDKEKGDALSYDQILVNGEVIAEGNDQVPDAKQLVDGSDGSVQTVAMYGWFGNSRSAVDSYGYMIDGGEPVYGEFKVPDALDLADVIAAGGDSRFKVVVDVSGLKDGQIHKIEVVARLQNGEIVLLNRNDKDRAVFVNYQAMLEESNPTTGDAAVALFAAAAVVMLGALVAFKRKRAF